jgi:hypothetical protein
MIRIFQLMFVNRDLYMVKLVTWSLVSHEN